VDPNELYERRRAVGEAAANLKRAVPRIRLLNEPLRRHHEGDDTIPAERTRGTVARIAQPARSER
jgi:hypothetical protein